MDILENQEITRKTCKTNENLQSEEKSPEIKEENEKVKGQDGSTSKPKYDSQKSPLMALGYIHDLDKSINYLHIKYCESLNKEEFKEALNKNIKDSYDKGDILCFSYGDNGDIEKQSCYSENKTVAFAVYSGFCDEKSNKIYAEYIRTSQGWSGVKFNNEYRIMNELNAYRMGKITFKNYEQANDFIKSLHEYLLPGETWNYAEPAKTGFRKKTKYEILESYLRTVFTALLEENNNPSSPNYNKIRFSKDQNYALFNTGLLSMYASDIFVIGEVFPRNRKNNEYITISNPVVLKKGKSELEEKGFDASDSEVGIFCFFNSISQIIYDANIPVDISDIDKLRHCIEEGIIRNRYPKESKKQYEKGHLEGLTDKLISAIKRAERIALRNYKYVVPQYRISATGNKIQFLMPIYMNSEYSGMPDFALVLSRGEDYYKPETVIELSWAYNNARVICKPDNTWLNPDQINEINSVDEFPAEE